MDYKALGLKVGLEIHCQLETHKLFCKCPSILKEEKPDFTIKRFLRASLSELGEKDVVAEFEQEKNKYAIYEGFKENTCLVELDEAPPGKINHHALNTALQIALLLKMDVIPEIQFMRKQVLDYSNTSSFQRTALVAMNGLLNFNNKKISIQSLCLEEDAARKTLEDSEKIVYRLDRLGIPLLEIATGPDINDPEEAKKIAEYLGMMLKSTEKVKRGIGTIRQDLNVSINKGARVEIKGVQDLRSIPKVIENEVKRQLELINNGKKVQSEVRKANQDNTTNFMRPMPSSSRMYPETDVSLININKKDLLLIKLPELFTEKSLALEKKYNLSPELAYELVRQKIDLGKYIKFKLEPELITKILIEYPKDVRARNNLDISKLKENDFIEILKLVEKGIPKEAIPEMFTDILTKGKLNESKYEVVSASDIESEIKKLVEKNKALIKEKGEYSIGPLMGDVMKKYRGKVDAKKISDLIRKEIAKLS
ncbi:MAG: Glu-tRNA(Gln) amidotransferase subunit GatE [Candidatus Nanoarchaeia archaeon]|nr:Glu-tRNA(Gln) amidotransferase subunit GatE [Candidatus Nanoarchaeia archaeon]MDD5588092.1 Glu-tRNA(Gln) amidotransferase subunit GatE [Candidatus Nanoarchaeia archaeon]